MLWKRIESIEWERGSIILLGWFKFCCLRWEAGTAEEGGVYNTCACALTLLHLTEKESCSIRIIATLLLLLEEEEETVEGCRSGTNPLAARGGACTLAFKLFICKMSQMSPLIWLYSQDCLEPDILWIDDSGESLVAPAFQRSTSWLVAAAQVGRVKCWAPLGCHLLSCPPCLGSYGPCIQFPGPACSKAEAVTNNCLGDAGFWVIYGGGRKQKCHSIFFLCLSNVNRQISHFLWNSACIIPQSVHLCTAVPGCKFTRWASYFEWGLSLSSGPSALKPIHVQLKLCWLETPPSLGVLGIPRDYPFSLLTLFWYCGCISRPKEVWAWNNFFYLPCPFSAPPTLALLPADLRSSADRFVTGG